MNIVFTNHSTEEIESDPIFENYIITNNYDTLNTIFSVPIDTTTCSKKISDKESGNEIIINTGSFGDIPISYYKYNERSNFQDYYISLIKPTMTVDGENGVEIMKIGVFDNTDHDKFYKILKKQGDIEEELLALSSDNKYLLNHDDSGFIHDFTNLNNSDDQLIEFIARLGIDENFVEESSNDIIDNSTLLRKNYYKSKIGNLLNYNYNCGRNNITFEGENGFSYKDGKVRLSTILKKINLLYPNDQLLVFILTCRE